MNAVLTFPHNVSHSVYLPADHREGDRYQLVEMAGGAFDTDLRDGSFVLVRLGEECPAGLHAVEVAGALIIRHVTKQPGGGVVIRSHRYPPVVCRPGGFRIVGRVVQIYTDMDRGARWELIAGGPYAPADYTLPVYIVK
jgi:hypothetical protein